MSKLKLLLLALTFATVAACSSQSADKSVMAPALVGESSKPGTYLAYEHTVSINAPAETLTARMDATRVACVEARFGACTLLSFDQSGARYAGGRVVVRIVPAGVEPLVKLASEGGEIGSRETKAEDRAEAIADIERKKDLLSRQQTRLLEFQGRKDLPVADVLALTRELAQIETDLDGLNKARANEQRRIETNLLTIGFRPDKEERASRWSRVGTAFGNASERLAEGVVDTVELVAYALPMLLVVFVLALILRWSWRRFSRNRSA